MPRDFHDLKVWQKSHRLTLTIYNVTRTLPPEERYGLMSQMRRAAASVAANIAEGCGRDGQADVARFFDMAMGSASELEYYVLLSHDLGFLASPAYQRLTREVTEVKRMLTSLTQKMRTGHSRGVPPRKTEGSSS